MKAKLTTIESAINEIIVAIPQRSRSEGWEWVKSSWTKAIKQALCDYAHQQGFRVAASGCIGADESEFLFDMVWWKQDEPYMSRIPLILESELHSSNELVDNDFYKLLIGRADHRIWIFERKTIEGVQESFDAYIETIRRFEHSMPGDRYLLLGIDWHLREFHTRLCIHG